MTSQPNVSGEANPPEYPEDAIKAHIDGEVVLYAIIRKDGSVDSIQLMRSLDPRLDKNAMAALARWKFLPGKRAGVPVDIEAVVRIPFEYKNPHELIGTLKDLLRYRD